MVQPANMIWADGPVMSPQQPAKNEIRTWGTWLESLISSGSLGDHWYASKAAATSAAGALANGTAVVVYGDATASNNGLYIVSSGALNQIADFLPGWQLVRTSDNGTSDANGWRLNATPFAPSTDGAVIFFGIVPYTNTSTNVYVSMNFGVTYPVKSISGLNPQIGDLVGGMPFFAMMSSGQFRLLNDSAIASSLFAARDAAQLAQAAAEAARDIAAGYASDAVSQGNVPIYGTVVGLPSLTVPLGINAIQINGWAAAGDGGRWDAVEIENTGPLLAGQQTSNAGTRRWELTQARTGAVPATALGAFTGTAIQDACDYMARNGGGEVYLPSGSFNSTIDGISVPKDMILRAGKGSLLSAAEPVTSIVKLNEWETVLRDVVFSNAGGNAQYAVMVDKPANAQPVTIEGCLFSGFSRSVNWVDGDMLNLNGNVAYNCELFLDVVNNCMNSNIEDNFVQGGSGFRFDKTTQGAEGVFIGSNRVFPAIAGAFCLRIDAGLEFDIEDNVWDQFVGVADPADGAIAAVSIDAGKHGDGSVRLIKSSGNWMGRNGSAANAKIGMFIGGPCRLIESLNDTYTGWQQAALEVDGPCVDIIIRGAKFYDGDRSLRDINLTNASRVVISGCKFSGYASIIENAGVDGRVDMCNWSDGAPLPPTISEGLKYGRQSSGMTLLSRQEIVMETEIPAKTFTHGMSYTPSIYHFRTVKGDANNSHLSIHDISATQATLAVNTLPPSNFSVGVECNMER